MEKLRPNVYNYVAQRKQIFIWAYSSCQICTVCRYVYHYELFTELECIIKIGHLDKVSSLHSAYECNDQNGFQGWSLKLIKKKAYLKGDSAIRKFEPRITNSDLKFPFVGSRLNTNLRTSLEDTLYTYKKAFEFKRLKILMA